MSIRTQRSSARFGAATVVAALLASLFAFASPAGAVQNVTQERVSGIDRYATAAEIAEEAFPTGASNVILASGENYPDGLAASGLAGFANAPVLLTTTDGLPAVTASALADLDADTVHVVGGTAAISQSVRDQVEALGYDLNELSGPNRYATAAAIAEYAATVAPIGSFAGGQAAIVATGENYADALSAGSPAYNNRLPILLTPTNSLAPSTSAALDDLGVTEVIVMGGTAAVSAATVDAIEALGIDVTRVSGADRYATATALGELLLTDVGDGGFGYDGVDVVLASGQNFADALAAGPWAGAIQAPLVLAEQCDLPAATSDFLTEHNDTIAYIGAAGGTAAICDAAFDAADAAATTDTPVATIMANEGASSITVIFSEPVLVDSVEADDFEYNNVALNAGNVVTPVDETTVGGDDVATTFVIQLDAGDDLAVGDIIDLNADTVETADGRDNVFTRVTVEADNTAPTATITAIEGQDQLFVTFSEPVVAAEAEAEAAYSVNSTTGGDGINGDGIYDPATRTVTLDLDADLESNDLVRLLGSSVSDLAGNDAPATSQRVFADNTPPSVASAEFSTSVTQNALATVGDAVTPGGEITITALPTGIAAGARANVWTIELENTDGDDPEFTLDTTNAQLEISFDFDDTTASGLNNFLLTQSDFTENFSVGVTTVGVLDAATVGEQFGAGTEGLTDVTVVVQHSEGVEDYVASDFDISVDGSAFNVTDVAWNVDPAGQSFDGEVTLTVSTDSALAIPVDGVSELYVSGYTDLSGNAIPNSVETLTAAD